MRDACFLQKQAARVGERDFWSPRDPPEEPWKVKETAFRVEGIANMRFPAMTFTLPEEPWK